MRPTMHYQKARCCANCLHRRSTWEVLNQYEMLIPLQPICQEKPEREGREGADEIALSGICDAYEEGPSDYYDEKGQLDRLIAAYSKGDLHK